MPIPIETGSTGIGHNTTPPLPTVNPVHDEDFTFFKQNSIEIQLRLSEQLESSEHRCLALQQSNHALEAQLVEKDEIIRKLREEIQQIQLAQQSMTITHQ